MTACAAGHGACRQPNDMFAEFVKAGQPLGGLADEDLCVLAALGCGNNPPGM